MQALPRFTVLLDEFSNGQTQAEAEIAPIIWQELHRLAESYMRKERAGHTLQATALVNEAYLRLVDMEVSWKSRTHFFVLAAKQMRRILVDYARARNAQKRGDGAYRVTFDEGLFAFESSLDDLIHIDQRLTQMYQFDNRTAEILELRLFSGLELQDIATLKHLSLSTVEREIRAARAWMKSTISAD